MPDGAVDVLVVGSGLCGLTVAVTAARRGFTVQCVSDGRPGSSLVNFGQLHSGAVYAPVLPEVAQACWQHRGRWLDLIPPALVGDSFGLALFEADGSVHRYLTAWRSIGIDAEEVDPRTADVLRTPAAAFRLPDLSVSLPALHAGLTDMARRSGVSIALRSGITLHRDPGSTFVAVDPSMPRASVVVLAAGADTPRLLSGARIRHTLHARHIAWGWYAGTTPKALTYWLDGDLLALSPDRTCVRVGLPAIDGRYASTEAELGRLHAALDRHYVTAGDHDLKLRWGKVCEPYDLHADPTALAIDVRTPRPGWTRTSNLIVAVPGKWTTAWHCADQVTDALSSGLH